MKEDPAFLEKPKKAGFVLKVGLSGLQVKRKKDEYP